MSAILAVDTSRFATSLAVTRAGSPPTVFAPQGPRVHPPKDELFLVVQALLERSGCALADLDALAVCVGPGSFTGLRIGLAMTKTFAMVGRLPLYALDAVSLEARRVARILGTDLPHRFCVVVPGYGSVTFSGLFTAAEGKLELEGDIRWPGDPEELAASIPEGLIRFVSSESPLDLENAVPVVFTEPSALELARHAGERLEAAVDVPLNRIQPLCLKPFGVGRKARRPEDFRS